MSSTERPLGDGNSAAPGGGRPPDRRSGPGAGPVGGGPQRLVAGSLTTLRLTRTRWLAVAETGPAAAIATVVGAWLLLAWARLGLQGLSAPRAGLRFVLVGVYGWLLLAAAVYVAGRAMALVGDDRSASFGLERTLQLTGLCHQPVVIVGLAVLVGSLFPVQGLLTVVAVAALGLWMPALLTVAVRSMGRASPAAAVAAAIAGYLVWAATAGRYLVDRVGHLL